MLHTQSKPLSADSDAEPKQTHHRQHFMHLPPEMHLQIISYLSYPDALALKHTNNYFYSLVTTSVQSRVDWIIERLSLGLPIRWKKCELRTDESFCKGDVKRTMDRRRRHRECRPGVGGCLVVVGSSCGGGGRAEVNRQLRRCKVLLKRGTGVVLEHQIERVLADVLGSGGDWVITLLPHSSLADYIEVDAIFSNPSTSRRFKTSFGDSRGSQL
ncbi:hypothetical protein PRK78_000322 [Emydomyces testavorans]|uniref:F-box domain-containing protein n=1 Tax=Emydomyces testavorans TaxID=2070801 RepID=A0AAF0IEB2_9EURO|nr:hypothetical protein PRK78_000322 [Emydomyces testavorans]